MEILEYYNWWFPGCPVRVQIGLRVVEQLQRRIQPATDGPAELEEGVLLGSVTSDGISITDFAPLLRIRESPKAEAISALTKKRGHQMLLGYYRTCQEEDLRLNEDDLALAEAAFGEPHHVFLLIRATGPSPATATFFFRDSGRMQGEVAFLDFPFDAQLLAAAKEPRTKPMPPPEPSPEPTATATATAVSAPATTVSAPATAVSAPAPIPVPDTKSAGGARPTRKGLRLVVSSLFAVGIIAALVALGVRFLPEVYARLRQPPKTLNETSLGLRVEVENGNLRVTWNRNADVIQNAASGTLLIQDGSVTREIPLDQTQMRADGILYAPTTDQVQIQLTVLGSKAAAELVMAILPKAPLPRAEVRAPAAASSETPAAPQSSAESIPGLQRPLKPFTLPANRASAAPQVDAVEPPPAVSAGLSQIRIERPLFFDAPSPPGQPPAPAAPPIRRLATYRPPVATTTVTPIFPFEARRLLSAPKTVEVSVAIDAAGKVVSANATAGENTLQSLVNAAVNAARRWKFQPARSDDRPVASEMVLRFTFSPQQ